MGDSGQLHNGRCSQSYRECNSLLLLCAAGNKWLIHYFDTGNAQWQEVGDNTQASRNSLVIPAGQAVILRRLGSGDNKLIPFPLPYTIDK